MMTVDYDEVRMAAEANGVFFYERACAYFANQGFGPQQIVESALQLSQTMATIFVGFVDAASDEDAAARLEVALKALPKQGAS